MLRADFKPGIAYPVTHTHNSKLKRPLEHLYTYLHKLSIYIF